MTGLSFDLTQEQEQLRQAVRDFTERECPKDVARRLEASKEFPEDLARRIAKAGLNGIGIPENRFGEIFQMFRRLHAQEQVIASADARQLLTQKHIDYPRSTDAPLHYDETGMVRHDCPNDSRILG